MDLLSYFRVLRRRWWVIVICVIVGVGLGWASTIVKSTDSSSSSARAGKLARTYYKATHTFLFKTANGSTYPSQYTNLDQIAILVTTGPVPDAVAKQLGTSENGAELAQQITTLTNSTTGTLAVIAVDPDSARAAQLADAFSDQLAAQIAQNDQAAYQQAITDANSKLSFIQGKINDLNNQLGAVPPPANAAQLTQQRDALQSQAADAYSNVQEVTSQSAPASPLSTLEKAQSVPIDQDEYQSRLQAGKIGANNLQAGTQTAITPTTASSSSSALDGTGARLALGAFIGLLFGIGLAVLLERLDRRIRTRADAEAAYSLPVLAEVPVMSSKAQRNHEVVTASRPLSPIAEAYRAVRSSLLFQQALAEDDAQPAQEGANPSLVVMVTSAVPEEGKTTSSANLAVAFAEAGSSVLLINCDFRRPTVHTYFDVSDQPRRVHTTQIPNLKVVSNVTGEVDANPAKVIATQRQVVAAARNQFDVIILDTAPLLRASDALEMAKESDLVVLIARSGWSKFPSAERAFEMLDRVDAQAVGTILVAASEADTGYYTYYQPRDRASQTRDAQAAPPESTNGNGSHADDWNLVLSEKGPEERRDT